MKNIHLENYRCFQNLHIEFADNINLIVGDNTSGKTTLLRALRSAMSTFFLGYSDENTRFLGLGKSDFTIRNSETSYMNELPIRVTFDYGDYLDPESESTHSTIASIELSSPKSRTKVSGAKEYKAYTQRLYKQLFDTDSMGQVRPLPLFANFSTEDIHASRRFDANRFKSYKHKPSLGYYECAQGDGLFSLWQKRLLILAEKNIRHPEVLGVTDAIRTALGVNGCNIIEDMEVRPLKGNIYYRFTDGREIDSDNLSDGYRRLASIVTGLAFRCMLLNQGIYGADAIKRTKGTALIDEIDLHLHPTLQSRVVGSLQRTFPCLQFIITTHAPMVMSGVESDENNRIYKMSYSHNTGYTQENIWTYGMDASTIIETQLNHSPRTPEVQQQLNELFNLIDDDKIKEAQTMLASMRTKFANQLPELSRAEAMLNFINPN